MGTLYETARAEFDKLRQSIKDKLEDGKLSFGEIWAIIPEFLRGGVKIMATLDAPGLDKKVAVLEALEELWDKDLQPLDLPGPDRLIDPILKALIMSVARGAIDYFVAKGIHLEV
jgi:hypothetical protein